MNDSTEFRINEFLSLKLEVGKTNIYINGEIFKQCKFLMLNVPIAEADTFEDANSIDEIADNLGWTAHGQREVKFKIDPQTEFMGHCSNLQAWHEHGYDTRLVHSNLAFPLLKALTKAGDIFAKAKFKEEIAKRFGSGNLQVMMFLKKEGYLEYLNKEESSLTIENAIENSFRGLKAQSADWIILNYFDYSKLQYEREKYLHFILKKEEAEIILELEKVINKEIIIETYLLDGEYVSSITPESIMYEGTPFTEYFIRVRDRSVRTLNMSECGLKYFPNIITRLKRLTQLILNGNNLKRIPKTLLNLRNLEYLSIALCGIQTIPKWFKKLEHLDLIYLGGNPLTKKSLEFIKLIKNIEFDSD